MNGVLNKSYLINGVYEVVFFVKKSIYSETYRVKDKSGKKFLLKLFNLSKMPKSAFDINGNVLEIVILKSINHENLVSYIDSDVLIIDNSKYAFLVLNFISGETISEFISRKQFTSIYDIKEILNGVLDGINYLHSLSRPIIHNELTIHNIMIDMSSNIPKPIIIDFGYARYFDSPNTVYYRQDLNPYYLANECFNSIFSPQTDLFSLGVSLYQLTFGLLPWKIDLNDYQLLTSNQIDSLLKAREKQFQIPNIENKFIDYSEHIVHVIKKALTIDIDNRFKSSVEFKEALNSEDFVFDSKEVKKIKTKENSVKQIVKTGDGFKDIAGMQELKEQLQHDVINAIKNPEEYIKHNITIPNGMLLYGPPGCGKTFFAEKFAEETGFNFIKILSSDIASIYVHGSQEKIGKIFKDARTNAPTILYFDELDAMVPNRDSVNNVSQSGEVNEFLSQLDNIGNSGVFVIGSTNKPGLIDKAILRAGRLENLFYIPPPDFEARKSMFELYLSNRPIDFGIDYNKLAELTENYVSSDIKLIIDNASRLTIKEKLDRISMETLIQIIETKKPTVPFSEIKKYEKIRDEIENIDKPKTKIGF